MEHKFTKMSFALLRYADKQYIQRACKDEAQRLRLREWLNEYLRLLGNAKNLDEEKLFLLGRELNIVWPKQFQRELARSVRENVEPKIAGPFLSGLGTGLEPSSKVPAHPHVPSRHNLTKLSSQLRYRPFGSVESRVRDLSRQYITYAEYSGDAQLLVAVFAQISEAILRMPAKDRQQGAGVVRELACSALRWEPWNGYFWTLWARAFLAQEASDAAELVYWETIRRIPSDSYARNQLAMLLRRLEGRMWEAIALARESAALFPRNEFTQNVLANVLLDSGDPANHKEAIDLLIRSLHRSPNHTAHVTLIGATLASDFETNSNATEIIRNVVVSLPNDPVLLGKIGKVISHQPSGLDTAESFFRASVARFNTDASLRNQLARVLVATGVPEKRDEAIRILRETKRSNPSDHYSRNQLAETLAASGDPEQLKEAIAILEETTQDELTDNKYSREMLAKLTRGTLGPPLVAEPAVSETEVEERGGDLGAVESSARVEQQLPPELPGLARMYRLRFRLTHSQGADEDAALNELRETLNNDPTFAYAQLLAVKQGLWEKDSRTLPSFPAAFEMALMDEDREALNQLAKQNPRLEALTLVARAVFGDADAARLVRPILDQAVQAKAGVEKMLRERVGPILRVIEGGRSTAASAKELRKRAVAELSKINEWAIGGGDWLVAVNF